MAAKVAPDAAADAAAPTRTDPEAALKAAMEDAATRDKAIAAFAAALLLGAGDTPGLR